MLVFLRRFAPSSSKVNPCILLFYNRYCSNSRPSSAKNELKSYPSTLDDNTDDSRLHLGGIYSLSLLSQGQPRLDSREIKVVDLDSWSVSSGLASVSKRKQKESQLRLLGVEEVDDEFVNNPKQAEDEPDIDEIEDMRIRGNLFYKIEKSSMEFEEYRVDFHGRKPKYNTSDEKESKKKESLKCDLAENDQKFSKGKVSQQVISKKSGLRDVSLLNEEQLARSIKEKYVVCTPHDHDSYSARMKQRSPTFNQLTAPFHEPFCLDIYVSKGSVRACVVHRVTSKVVAVAHSISKDIKFDLGSTKSRVAAATVGEVVAQRALADDIHDVIYTPRKGDKLEGKLKVVLQSIIDNGVNVKVRLKQRNPSKAVRRPPDD